VRLVSLLRIAPLALAACSPAPAAGGGGGGGASATDGAGSPLADSSATPPDLGPVADLALAPPADTIDANRGRLLSAYLDYLIANPSQTQSNGLSGASLTSVCDLFARLDPSSRDVFLTLTARMQGSTLGSDGSSMLSHITRLYRVSGGQGATASDPGSCGGGEYNRMIMSMDSALHAAQLAANRDQGARQANGRYDIADIPAPSFWRNSHDLGGPHAPFDLSDETNQGAPRGQTQYFSDPTSTLASSPLGRLDLMTLIDPYAVEMDQDYDCIHNSNPDCTYITYGPLCLPQASALGTAIYTKSYGDYGAGWRPAGCAP
jgi:hypothetical protein